MNLKFFLLWGLILSSFSVSYAQDAWEQMNVDFQEYFAQEKYELALKIAEKEFEYVNNSESPIYQKAFSSSDIGLALYALKRHKEAEVFLLKAVDYNLEMSGKDSDNTLTELNQLAMNYAAMNETEKADSLLRIIINTKEKKHGKESEETLDAVQLLIKMHDALGNSIEVNKLRALYNIPEPNCNCPGKEKAIADSLKALENLVNEPVVKIDSSQSSISAKPMKAEPSSSAIIHTVKKGDTLYSISVKYKVTVKELKVWNKLKTNLLMSGQKLKIQKD